jgi:chromate transporter
VDAGSLLRHIGAAVIAIIARGALKLAERTVGRDRLLAAVMLANAAVVVWTEHELLWVFVLIGVSVPVVRRLSRPAVPDAATSLLVPWGWWITGLHGAADRATLVRVFGYFAKAGLVVFGSGLAVVPFLHGGVVGRSGGSLSASSSMRWPSR